MKTVKIITLEKKSSSWFSHKKFVINTKIKSKKSFVLFVSWSADSKWRRLLLCTVVCWWTAYRIGACAWRRASWSSAGPASWSGPARISCRKCWPGTTWPLTTSSSLGRVSSCCPGWWILTFTHHSSPMQVETLSKYWHFCWNLDKRWLITNW